MPGTMAHGQQGHAEALCHAAGDGQEAIDEEEMSSFARSISTVSIGSGDREGDMGSRLGSSPHLGRAHPSGAPACLLAGRARSPERD